MLRHLPHQVVLHQRVVQGIHALGLLAVELQHVSMLHILVDAVQVVHRPGIFRRRVQQVDAEAEVGLLVVQHSHDGGQDVYLLGDLVLHLSHRLTGVVDDDRRAESAYVRLVEGMVAQVGMVAGQYEDGVLEPRLVARLLEELPNGHIRVADALVDLNALLGIHVLVLLWHVVGVMAAGREDGRHEGLFHLRHLRGVVLQEGLVPDRPHAVEVVVTAKARVVIIVLAPVVLLEACASCKGHEAHRTALGTMEEGRLIALASQQRGDAAHLVHGGGRQEEGLYEHGDARQDAGHAVDALTAITETIAEGGAMADERIDMRGIALVLTILQGLVQGSDILAPETLHDQHHYILFK